MTCVLNSFAHFLNQEHVASHHDSKPTETSTEGNFGVASDAHGGGLGGYLTTGAPHLVYPSSRDATRSGEKPCFGWSRTSFGRAPLCRRWLTSASGFRVPSLDAANSMPKKKGQRCERGRPKDEARKDAELESARRAFRAALTLLHGGYTSSARKTNLTHRVRLQSRTIEHRLYFRKTIVRQMGPSLDGGLGQPRYNLRSDPVPDLREDKSFTGKSFADPQFIARPVVFGLCRAFF